MATFQLKATELYREIAQVPVATEGRIFRSSDGGLYEVEVKWSQKDLRRESRYNFAKSYLVRRDNKGLSLVTTSSFQRDISSVSLESYSSAGQFKAVLKGKADPGTGTQQIIEIWSSNNLIKSFDVKEQFGKKHGKINDDNHFSSFQLSSDGSKLLYIAEKKIPESVSYFKRNIGDEKTAKEMGTRYVYREGWGEMLTTVINPVVIVLDIQSEECTVVNSPPNFSCGRARWVPNSTKELIYVGYVNEPVKIGLLYCFNRKSVLFCANLETNKSTPLTDDSKYVYGLCFNKDGSTLVFLQNDTDVPYPQRNCLRVDWETKKIGIIAKNIDKPTNDGFTGLCARSLPNRCWGDDDRIYYDDMQKCYSQIMRINVNTGSVSCITSDTEKGEYVVLDVFEGLLLGQYTNPAHPMKIFVAELPTGNKGFKQTDFCDIASTMISTSDNIKWEVLQFNREASGGFPYEAIFISPRVTYSSPPPLAIFVHGGPHMVCCAHFNVWNACLVSLGYSVMLVNYNGSTGYGQEFLRALVGKVGTMDVEDIQFAAETVVTMGKADGKRLVLYGGSHAGFIAIHLITRYPDFYQAIFLRNPVINIASLRNETDIKEWAHTVSGIPYDAKNPPTADDYSKMLNMSPILQASKIKAAVALAIGAKDKRCPPSQAKELYELLHAQGKDVSMFMYPDHHPLESVDIAADCFMQCALHFDKNTAKKT